MAKEFFIVAAGSFFGGGARFLLSKWIQGMATIAFPLGTMAVNVIGCLVIGFVSGLSVNCSWASPSTRLFLTTGFCGGFTTFSTFMNENSAMMKDGNYSCMMLYIFGSLAIGLACVLLGQWLARQV